MSNFNNIDGPSIEDIKKDLEQNTYMKALIHLGELENKYNIPKKQRITVYEEVSGKEYPFAVNGKNINDVIERYNNLIEFDIKIKNLKMMDNVARKINDEEIIDYWLTNGVPDSATDEDFKDIVENNDFDEMESVFKKIIHEAIKDGLYNATKEEFEFAKRYEPKIQNEKLRYRTIVKAKVKNIYDKEESEVFLLCRQYNDKKLIKVENVGLDIILDKSFFEDLTFLNGCDILEFEHIAKINNISELKEVCNKYELTDIDKCMKGNRLDCEGLLINEDLVPIGFEGEIEETKEEEEEI